MVETIKYNNDSVQNACFYLGNVEESIPFRVVKEMELVEIMMEESTSMMIKRDADIDKEDIRRQVGLLIKLIVLLASASEKESQKGVQHEKV